MSIAAIFLSLIAAMFYSLSGHIQTVALRHLDIRRGTVLSLVSMAVPFWIMAPFLIEWDWFATRAALILMACGLVFPAASQSLQILSMARLGPAIGTALGSFGPVFAILPAVAFLGDSMSLTAVFGLIVMMLGVICAGFARHSAFRPFALWALLIPLGAAFFRGITQPAAKFAMDEVPSPFFAALVMITVSAVLMVLLDQRPGKIPPGPSARKGRWLFALNGLTISSGILTMQIAISLENLSLVAPLLSTTPLWTLVLALIVFRKESPTLWHLVVATLVVTGSVLIVTH